MGIGAKIGIGLGALVIVGGIAFTIYKMKQSKVYASNTGGSGSNIVPNTSVKAGQGKGEK